MHIVLNTFGTYLAVDNGNFAVVHSDGKNFFEPKNIKSISISKGAQISSDAALLAISNNIDVFFIDNIGKPVGRIWSNKFGSITTIRRKQLDFTLSKHAVDWIKQIICEKMNNQIVLLLAFNAENNDTLSWRNRQINKIKVYKSKIEAIEANNIAEVAQSLRGWEGVATRSYFSALNKFVPNEYKFDERSQHPAKDVFNCLLNYGYGMLYGKIEAELIRSGIDPYIGILHREDYNRPVLTFDVIEKFRVWIDYVVMQLVINKAVNNDCFSIKDDGSYWLENLGKRIVIQSVNDYFEEIIDFEQKRNSRTEQIKIFAQKLAKMFF